MVKKNLIGLTAKCGGACCVIVIVLGVEHVAMAMTGDSQGICYLLGLLLTPAIPMGLDTSNSHGTADTWDLIPAPLLNMTVM